MKNHHNSNSQGFPPQKQVDFIIELYSNGKIDEAIKKINFLNEKYPNVPLLFNILGACYKNIGELNVSLKMFHRSIELKPDYAEAFNNMGTVLIELNQFKNASKAFSKAISINPNYIQAHNNLGNSEKKMGNLDSAEKSYKKVLELNPHLSEVFNNLGIVMKDLGKFTESLSVFEQAIAISKDTAEIYFNYASTLMSMGRFEDAINALKKAVSLKPNYIQALNNLGISYRESGDYDSALSSLERAISFNPDFAEAYNNIGITLIDVGNIDGAIEQIKKALIIDPNYAFAHNTLGTAYYEIRKLHVAVKCFENATKIKSDFAEGYINKGNVLRDLKFLDEALISYQNASKFNPNLNYLFGYILSLKMSQHVWYEFDESIDELKKKIKVNSKVILPHSMLTIHDNPKLQKKVSSKYADVNFKSSKFSKKPVLNSDHKKIKVGYYSADFRDHPVSYLTAELYELHDRNMFEVYAFSIGIDTKDEMNLRIKAGVDNFYNVNLMTHREIVELSHSLEIDIAVDLGGYTQNSRPKIFSMHIAPIQINFLGYAGTMGSDFMHYLVADHTVIPKGNRQYYSEKIAYLPNSFIVGNNNDLSKKIFTRKETGLPDIGFVFCCFNNHYKISPDTFRSWMKILSEVNESVIWLPETDNTSMDNLKKEAVYNGIDENRLIFAPKLESRVEHLNRIQLADLFLDTLPYNAHATTADALRMGLPVLTLMGESFAGRVAASFLNSVELPELITKSRKHYESLAIKLAKNPELLQSVRYKLSLNVKTEPLFNKKLYIKHLESAFLTMYKNKIKGIDPDHIYVEK